MATNISDESLVNDDSIKLLRKSVEAYEEYFNQVIILLRNLFLQNSQSLEACLQTLVESERKEMSEALQKIQTNLKSVSELEHFEAALKLFAEGQHVYAHDFFLEMEKIFKNLLIGIDTSYQINIRLIQFIDSKKTDFSFSTLPELSIFIKHAKKILSKVEPPKLRHCMQSLFRILTDGVKLENNFQRILSEIRFRSMNVLSFHILFEAQKKELVQSGMLVPQILSKEFDGFDETKPLIAFVQNSIPTLEQLLSAFTRTSELAKKLDNISSNVLRLVYLSGGFSLISHHIIGYCAGDTLGWFKKSIQLPVAKKEHFRTILSLHEQDADQTVLYLYFNQLSNRVISQITGDEIFHEDEYQSLEPMFQTIDLETTDGSKKVVNTQTALQPPLKINEWSIQKFITKLFESVKGAMEKHQFQGAIYVSLRGNKDRHSVGFKSVKQKQGLVYHFRDINVGEFYCEDWRDLKDWFYRYYCYMEYFTYFNKFIVKVYKQKPSSAPILPGFQAHQQAANATHIEAKMNNEDDKIRSELRSLAPKLHKKKLAFKVAQQIIPLYLNLKNKDIEDHYLALCCYIKLSSDYLDDNPQKLQTLKSAYQLDEVLVKLNPDFSYEQTVLLDYAKYLISIGEVSTGSEILKKALDRILAIDPIKVCNNEGLKELKTIASHILDLIKSTTVDCDELLEAISKLNHCLLQYPFLQRTDFTIRLRTEIFIRELDITAELRPR